MHYSKQKWTMHNNGIITGQSWQREHLNTWKIIDVAEYIFCKIEYETSTLTLKLSGLKELYSTSVECIWNRTRTSNPIPKPLNILKEMWQLSRFKRRNHQKIIIIYSFIGRSVTSLHSIMQYNILSPHYTLCSQPVIQRRFEFENDTYLQKEINLFLSGCLLMLSLRETLHTMKSDKKWVEIELHFLLKFLFGLSLCNRTYRKFIEIRATKSRYKSLNKIR